MQVGFDKALPPLVVHPKYYRKQYYLITVNGTNQWLTVRFRCKWFPGYHRQEGTQEIPMPPVEALFEGWPSGSSRYILVEATGATCHYPPSEFTFYDDFEPHQRHVYKMPAEEKPNWWVPWWAAGLQGGSDVIIQSLGPAASVCCAPVGGAF